MKKLGALDNYLAMHRERAGLSQDDLAVLVFLGHGRSVGRYEEGVRYPDLITFLALEVVLGQPGSELYAGVAEDVRARVRARARALLESIRDRNLRTPTDANRLSTLSRLAQDGDVVIEPIWEEHI